MYDELLQFVLYEQQHIKMLRYIIIILASIRDKKGTYPALKLKYSEFMDEFMSQQPKSDKMCESAEVMKFTYKQFEVFYSILK